MHRLAHDKNKSHYIQYIYALRKTFVKTIFRYSFVCLCFTDKSDFVGGIDNEALDFSHLTDEFIQNNNAEANQ